MPVECTCIKCGKKFTTKNYKKDTAKYCSRECMNEYRSGKRRGEWVTKICPSCGKEFESLKSKNKKYCSPECVSNRNDNHVIYYCDVCGKEIRMTKWQYQYLTEKQKTITCSKECSNIQKNNGIKMKCPVCGKEIYRAQFRMNLHKNHFCSNECQFIFKHQQNFEIRKCEICGKSFECSKFSSQRFCSNSCVNKWQASGEGKMIHQKQWAKMLSQGKIYTQSKPQIIINNILKEMNITYTNEKNLNFYAVDNYLDDYDLIIEVMGDYWHINPLRFSTKINDHQRKRIVVDKSKHTYIKDKFSIDILYLWEMDIINNKELCQKLIQLYVNQKGVLENYHSFNYHLTDSGEIKLNNILILPYQERSINEYKHLFIA